MGNPCYLLREIAREKGDCEGRMGVWYHKPIQLFVGHPFRRLDDDARHRVIIFSQKWHTSACEGALRCKGGEQLYISVKCVALCTVFNVKASDESMKHALLI